MSRPRKPTAVLEASGAFVHDPQRRRAPEPAPTGPLGGPPDHLDDHEKGVWHEFAALLPDKVAWNADRPSFELAVCLMAQFRHHRGAMTGSQQTLLASLLGRFGMSPVDRLKISIPASGELDPLEEFLQRRTQ